MKRVALVTGANRGIGLECVRELAEKGYETILTARNEKKGKEVVAVLKKEKLPVHFFPLDVSDPAGIDALHAYILNTWGRLDVLINNAGVLPDSLSDEKNGPFFTEPEETYVAFSTNTVGPFFLCQKFVPLMLYQGYGRIVNVSSQWGQLASMTSQSPAYSLSKAALNAVTKIYADRTVGTKVLINSVCPGWVKTDMGGKNADLTPEESAEDIFFIASLNKETGLFWRDREIRNW